MMANIRHVANSRKPEGVGGNEEAPVAGMPCTMMGRRPFFDQMRDAGGRRGRLPSDPASELDAAFLRERPNEVMGSRHAIRTDQTNLEARGSRSVPV